MATIHQATVTPGKLDLLAAWLPGRPWFDGTEPRLVKAGGFRLDDPDGEVGIEVLAVAETTGPPQLYLTPLTYRDAPLAGAETALIGTAEHSVLGRRWVYDALHDPVAVAQFAALAAGRAAAQHQDVSDTPADTVVVTPLRALAGPLVPELPLDVTESATATSIGLVAGADAAGRRLTLHVARVPGDPHTALDAGVVVTVDAVLGARGGAPAPRRVLTVLTDDG